jgi:isoaspartyl peptidase/L-asparaginase-like protein (Ntn-hydrolase superfamily)
MKPRLVIHGGAGVIDPEHFPEARRAAVRATLSAILSEVWALLEGGAGALDAVERAVVLLEDSEYFNAGRGSVLNAEGEVEMDAALMDGRERRAGGVAAVRGLRNPIRAARAVLEHRQHVLLCGEGARRFALTRGLEAVGDDWLVTADRRAQLERARAAGRVSLDHDEVYAQPARERMGTVGAVARDREGHLAAATSTGGMTNKLPGRIGDSPLLGAGTFADDATCAVSTTGTGEAFMRGVSAYDLHARLRYGEPLAQAAEAVIADARRFGGAGGLIAVDRAGNLALPFDTPGMYRGWIDETGAPRVGIYRDD